MIIRRIFAYLVDLIFIILVTTMLAQIRFLNPHYESYYDANSKYQEIYENALKDTDYNFMNSDEYTNVMYEIKSTSISNSIIEIICYIAYFVGFQVWNKGQTLGKKLMKIKIVNKDDSPVKWNNLLIRTIVLYSIYAEVISIILILGVSQKMFISINEVLSTITMLVFYSSAIMIILKKDGRGLHDLIAGTKVVEE